MNQNLYTEGDRLFQLRVRLVRGLLLFATLVTGSLALGHQWATEIEFFVTLELLVGIAAFSALLLLVSFWERLLPVLFWLVPLLSILASYATPNTRTRIIILVVAGAFAGVMVSRRVFMVFAVPMLLSFVVLIVNIIPPDASLSAIVLLTASLVGVGFLPVLIGFIVVSFMQTLRNALQRAREGYDLLETSVGLGTLFSGVYDERLLASIAVESIQQNFGVEHVQIFLVGESGNDLRFAAGTGSGERSLLDSQYALPFDSLSALTRAAKVREWIVVRGAAVRTERQRSDLDFLPSTRAEFIFPVRGQDEAFGVVDIQRSSDEMLSETAVKGIQVLINQFAAALQTAQLFREQERGMLENKRLFLDAQTNYREIERLNQQLTRQVWRDFLETRQSAAGITLDERTQQSEAAWTSRMIEASRRRRPIRETEEQQQHIAMPIELRGEVIGVVEIATEADADYDSTLELMRSVSQRLANSLETARLFEVERETSIQEQRLSDLVSQYQSAATVDELLQITLKELATTLGAEDGSIRLGIMEPQKRYDIAQPQGGESA